MKVTSDVLEVVDEDIVRLHDKSDNFVKRASIGPLTFVIKERKLLMLPENIASSDYKDRFDRILYMNLHCNDVTRETRLRSRGWNEYSIEDHKNFANWLLQNSKTAYDPEMSTIDTTELTAEDVAEQIKAWVLKNWR